MIGDIMREETDIGWANMFMLEKRQKLIDFSEPYRYDLSTLHIYLNSNMKLLPLGWTIFVFS